MAASFDPDHPYGERTLTMLGEVRDSGANAVSLLMRHSAREYAPGRHDLENPLTEVGRSLARQFGLRLAPEWVARGYASPVARCEDTAELIHAAHLEVGGRGAGGSRPVEALGVFYVLDQMRMFKALSVEGGGMAPFVEAWVAGRVAADIMIPARDAARILLTCLRERLRSQKATPGLDLCVTHDLTLYLLRAVCFGKAVDEQVLYLDGIAFQEDGGAFLATTHDAATTDVSDLLST